VKDLLDAGVTRAEVLDIVAAIAVPMLAGTVFQVTAAALDGAFQPQAWTPSAA
jgi:hypothetical protein